MRIHQAQNIITWAVLAGIAAFGLGIDAFPQKVSGTVKDIRGRGVTGAEVTITRTTGTVQATTDRDGYFVSIADPMGAPFESQSMRKVLRAVRRKTKLRSSHRGASQESRY